MPYKNPERQRAARREWYENNKAINNQRSKESKRKSRLRLAELKEATPCTDCREYYPHFVMDYDHVKGDKTSNISAIICSKGWNFVLEEIAKCELVCANCHRYRTWERLRENNDLLIFEG